MSAGRSLEKENDGLFLKAHLIECSIILFFNFQVINIPYIQYARGEILQLQAGLECNHGGQ
jgi:hypothetical protein